jgi:hypothetical protein
VVVNSAREQSGVSASARKGLGYRGRLPEYVFMLALVVGLVSPALHAREHKSKEVYGAEFSVEVPAPEGEVLQAVYEVVNDGIIEGSKEYNKDKFIEKASAADSSKLFPEWKEPGKVFYKVRTKVLAPVNFKESGDEGTLAVRYVVLGQDATKTILKIEALFAEDFRHTVHPSNGSVESGEYKAIQDHIDAIELQKKKDAEGARNRQEELARQALERRRQEEEALSLAEAETSAQTLQQKVQDLRRQVERVIKAPGAPLKSAPFHTATTLKSLETGSEVVILISTPYWYGVETLDGQHGWVNRQQLEPLP